MKKDFNRREFIKTTAFAGAGFAVAGSLSSFKSGHNLLQGKKVGIIGLDTSHSVAFTKALNAENPGDKFKGYKVAAAYPQGSKDIQSAVSRVPGYIEEVKKQGVEIVSSIEELLKKVDFVLLESNDGRVHLEQALPVLKAGKTMFVDKPVAASLADAVAIFDAAKKYNVPVFSSSSTRFMESAQAVLNGSIGDVLGAETYSPSPLESTHPDFFWYGIHGVELLYTVMGAGCESVVRVHTDGTDVTVGTWKDGRIGTFRGTRTGKNEYGGTAFGQKANQVLGPLKGYDALLLEIVDFFDTGKPPVSMEETTELCAFIEAADESKRRDGEAVKIAEMMQRLKK